MNGLKDHGHKTLVYTATRELRDLAISRVHDVARRNGIKVKTEKISPTRFVVKCSDSIKLEAVVVEVAKGIQKEMTAAKVEME